MIKTVFLKSEVDSAVWNELKKCWKIGLSNIQWDEKYSFWVAKCNEDVQNDNYDSEGIIYHLRAILSVCVSDWIESNIEDVLNTARKNGIKILMGDTKIMLGLKRVIG